MLSPEELKPIVREVLGRLIKNDGPAAPTRSGPRLINAQDVMAARAAGALAVPEGAIVTPLARDTAERFGVRLSQGGAPAPAPRSTPPPAPAVAEVSEKPRAPAPLDGGAIIAIGSDHGGFKLKERLRRHLEGKSGLRVIDCGSYDGSSCDYPDLACAVARAVALQEADFGLLVDGAGIGSCMAANKVPGVLAANCHSPATARNSREHNGANVLCLGSGHLDEDQALAILEAWLSTPFGGGRHGRRVAKIEAIERAFSKGGSA